MKTLGALAVWVLMGWYIADHTVGSGGGCPAPWQIFCGFIFMGFMSVGVAYVAIAEGS